MANSEIIGAGQESARRAPKDIRILVACECSGRVRDAFIARGFDAMSCDLKPTKTPGPHYQGSVFDIINDGWDLMVAHPPCTHLAVSGMRWFKPGCVGEKPAYLKEEGASFFMSMINAPIKLIAVENPVCIMSSRYRKPDQIINPWQFGHPEQKKTCLWLKGLPKLIPTNNVFDYMMTLPLRDRTRIHWLGGGKSEERSVTYQGIANGMAEQWGAHLLCANSPAQNTMEICHTAPNSASMQNAQLVLEL